MFEEFSGGYYLGRLYVRPSDSDRALMHRHLHEQLNERLYAEGEGVERLDAPLVMKLDNTHFAVHGDGGVAADTLAVPDELLGDRSGLPSVQEVFLAKGDRARQLLEMVRGYKAPDAT